MSLQRGEVLMTFTVNGTSSSVGQYRTHQDRLAVGPTGAHPRVRGRRHPTSDGRHPVTRTSSPYSLSEAVENLASDIQGTDTDKLNQSLDTLSGTLNQISPQLGPAFDGVTRLSQTLNSRNQTLGELLKGAADVTGILSQRSAQLNTLILTPTTCCPCWWRGGRRSCGCCPAHLRWPSSCPAWCTTTSRSWHRRWRS